MMESEGSKKRKREADPPRITFITPSRTFERLFKENSLGDLNLAVIKKLGLSAGAKLEFAQIRGSKSIDLEDDDDFEAFKSYAISNGSVEVKVDLLGSTRTVQAAQPQTLPNDNMERTSAVPPAKKKKTSHDKPIMQPEAPLTLERATTAADTQTVKKAKLKKSESASPPDVQKTSEKQSNPPNVDNTNDAPLVKKKSKRKEEQASHVEPIASSSSTAVDDSVTGATSQKKRKKKSAKETPKGGMSVEEPSLAKTSRIPTALETHDAPSAPIVGDTSVLAKDAPTQTREQGTTANVIPPKEKEKVERKKKEKKTKEKEKEKPPAVDALPAASTQSSMVSPPAASIPIPPTALTAPSEVALVPKSAVPLQEPKLTKSKKLKSAIAPEAESTASPAQVAHPSEPPSVAPLTKKKVTKKKSENVEKDVASELPSKGEQKANKRKLDEPVNTGGAEKMAASKSGEKKHKANETADKLTPIAPSPEPNANKSSVLEAAPVVKPKAPAKKKKGKTGAEIDDEKFERLVSGLLGKRVSGSSTQTHATTPVTTTVSSASMPTEGSSTDSQVVTSPLAPPESSLKKKQKPNATKGKLTKDLQAKHKESISGEQAAVSAPVLDRESNRPQPSAPRPDKRSEIPQRLLQKVDGLCTKVKSLDPEGSTISAETTQSDDSMPKVDSMPSLSESTIDQPSQQDHLKPKPVGDQLVGTAINGTATLSKPRASLAPMNVLPFAPSGSSISEILIQGKDEGSSSESESDSSEDDDSDNGVKVAAIHPSQDLPSRPAPFNAGNDGVNLRTSFPVGILDIGPNTDLEALLKPKKHLSWRDIPMSPKTGSDDENEKLLTDLEEEDEEEKEKENRKKPRRSSLALRRESSSPSADEDEEEDKNLTEHHEIDNTSTERDSEVDPNTFEPFNDNAANEDKKLTSTPEGHANIIQAALTTDEIGTETALPLVDPRSSPSQSPRLAYLKDVNERGESVFADDMGNLAVSQAMEEDNTTFLTSLDGLSRETFTTIVQIADEASAGDPNKEHATNESAHSQVTSEASSKNPDGDELDQLNSSSIAPSAVDPASGSDEPVTSVEEQKSEVPFTASPRQSGEAQDSCFPNDVNSNAPKSRPTTPVRESAPDASSQPKNTGPGTQGTLRRMKDRYGKPVSLMKPLAQLSTSQNETPGSSISHDHAAETAPEELPVLAHPPRYVTRRSRSIISAEPSSSQVSVPIGTRTLTRQRKKTEAAVIAPAVTEVEEADPSGIASRLRKRGKKSELEIGGAGRIGSQLTQTSQGRTGASRNSNLRTVTTESSGPENNHDGRNLPELDMPPMIETIDGDTDGVRSLPVGKDSGDGKLPQMEDSKSASTTDVEGSISGDYKNDSDVTSTLVSTQPVQKETPKERAESPAASSSSEESESDEPVQAKSKLNFSHRPSLNGFHSLNDIAKRQDLFSPVGTPRPSFALSPVATFGSQSAAKGLANNEDDDEESSSSSSSSSDSDDGKKPNIPRERRAGSSVPKPRKSYLGL